MSRALPPQPVQSSKIPSARAIHMLRKLKRRSTKRERTRSHPIIYTVSYAASLLLGTSLGPDPGCVTGRTGSCTPQTAPNAGQSAGASWMELDGEPGTVSLRRALRLRRLCDSDGEEAPWRNGGSNHRQGLRIGGCQPHTLPGPWTRYPAAPRMCWCPTCRKDEEERAIKPQHKL
jgi:hypothetical protein